VPHPKGTDVTPTSRLSGVENAGVADDDTAAAAAARERAATNVNVGRRMEGP